MPRYVDMQEGRPYALTMDINLTDDQKAFIRQAIAAGRLGTEEEAVREAMTLWEERERARAQVLSAVQTAEVSLAEGGGRTISESSMRELANEVKQRGRARLARKQNRHR